MERFVLTPSAERASSRLAPCPPHIRKAWHLGMARRKAAAEKQHPMSRVANMLATTTYKFVFEQGASWKEMPWDSMTEEDQVEASHAWKKAEYPPVSDSVDEKERSAVLEKDEDEEIAQAMVKFMEKQMRWSHKELHDALLAAEVAVPAVPSMRNYFAALHAQYGDVDTGFLPQSFHSHTKAKLKDILRIFARTGTSLGGKLADHKGVLAERLAHWLNRVVEAGRSCKALGSDGESVDKDDFQSEAPTARPALVEHTHEIGQVPENAVVTAEQAESALGRTLATEIDIDLADTVDPDTKEEEEKLAGYQVNPSGVNYACVSWQPDVPGSVSAEIVCWDAGRAARPLSYRDFACTANDVKGKMHNSLNDVVDGYKRELEGALVHQMACCQGHCRLDRTTRGVEKGTSA